MAGEIVLTFAVEELLKKVSSIGIDGIVRAWGLKKDLENLMESTRRIQNVLQEADKQATNERVNPWLLKLQDVVYTAEDVLDEFSYETLRRGIEIQNQLMRKVCDFVSRSNPILFRLNMSQKVKKINESLADIEKQATHELALRGVAGVDHRQVAPTTPMNRETDSIINKSEPLIGRISDVEAIINMLQVNSFNTPPLTVVSIVGIGGLGKTTLAQLVLEEAKKKNIFDETMWVCVSDTFDDKVILRGMLENLSRSSSGLTTVDAILKDLQAMLKNKRFLLVLDDVWNKESKKWESLKDRLLKICYGNGNFVVVTTRSWDVANTMETNPEHILELKQLSDEECWSIIKGKVLLRRDEPVSEELEKIGIDIAKKCKGVPLVAKVLGGTLGSKRSREEWLSIRSSDVWKSRGEDNGVLSVLKLSFDKLDPSLKPCFKYCSLLPKDFTFDKEKLIQLWMAEGFLYATSTNGGTSADKSMEDIGDNYLNNLLSACFFQDVKDRRGNFTQCKMHDLLHDLALSVSGTKMLELDNGSTCILKTFYGRRINFDVHSRQHSSIEELVRDHVQRNVRSLFSNVDVFHVKCANFKSLRTVDMSKAIFKELPTSIGKMKHLRFLDLSWNDEIEELPESVGKLYNLQTLRLLGCWQLSKLPRTIRNLANLRHICFDERCLTPFKVGCLTNLRTLPLFAVRQEEGCNIQELEHLNELRGKLNIFNLENVRNGSEAVAANLKGKKLSNLKLTWEFHDDESLGSLFLKKLTNSGLTWEFNDDEREDSQRSSNCNHEEVLEALQPPESIMSFTIRGYMGKLFPKWMCKKVIGNGDSQSPLSQLAELELLGCEKCEIMPTLGHLPSLKILEIESMENVRRIGSEFYGESKRNVKLFPVLEKLRLSNMKSLEEWEAPDEQTNLAFHSLQELVIDQCNLLKSICLSHLFSLRSMKIFKSPKLISLPIVSASLENLEIQKCGELESISSSQDLVSLKRIFISECEKLTSLPIGSASASLEIDISYSLEIDISYCSKLTSLPTGSASLEILRIVSCEKLESISSTQDLVSLKRIVLSGCPKLTSLPIVSASLEYLYLYECEKLESISCSQDLVALNFMKIESCCKLTSLPKGLVSLKVLRIKYCDNLESISNLQDLVSLNFMEIWDCSKLTLFSTGSKLLKSLEVGSISNLSADAFSGLSSLQSLRITFMDLIPSVEDLTSLQRLDLKYCHGLASLPVGLQLLKCLQVLSIYGCDKITALAPEIKSCTSLKRLDVTNCKGLISIETDIISSLTQLEELLLGPFSDELVEFPGFDETHPVNNPFLKELSLQGGLEMKSLPFLGHLTALRKLTIRNFGISELPFWVGQLLSLEELNIRDCKSLISLPSTMQQLSKLTKLYITGSPLLKQKFEEDRSALWPNISHIKSFLLY